MHPESSEIVAAVDVGSNSFHMTVARVLDGQLRIVDRMKEMVRLAGGLDASEHIDAAAQARALACLRRFGERLRAVPPERVRAVGTNTLRRARNADDFLARAELALGHPIEVVAGREEARLIYLGVAHNVAQDHAQRLVVDIGGGSTELAIGRHLTPVETESLYMGCVEMSRRFFADGRIRRSRLRAAALAARQELEAVEARFRGLGWDAAVGASGTILAVGGILHGMRWAPEGVTLEGLRRLQQALVEAGHVERLALPGLKPERAPVFPGGVAILSGVFEALGIERMSCCDAALREGLLYDLLGRMSERDVREDTIADLCRRYRIDAAHAARVERTALELLRQVAAAWGLEDARLRRALAWGAQLHELGLAIAHAQYHKHGAYVLQHADLPGFSRSEQALLAALVRAHRRKFPAAAFAELPPARREPARRLAVLLRLAAVLHRSRSADNPAVQARAEGRRLRLTFPAGWLDAHPLSAADLDQEAEYLRPAGIELQYADALTSAGPAE